MDKNATERGGGGGEGNNGLTQADEGREGGTAGSQQEPEVISQQAQQTTSTCSTPYPSLSPRYRGFVWRAVGGHLAREEKILRSKTKPESMQEERTLERSNVAVSEQT